MILTAEVRHTHKQKGTVGYHTLNEMPSGSFLCQDIQRNIHMFAKHYLRCGGTNYHSRWLFVTASESRRQGEAGQGGFWHRHFTIHPLEVYCFKFGSNWGTTWARLRPTVRTLSTPHISARQNRLQLYRRLYVSDPTYCLYRTSEILQATTCWSSETHGGRGGGITFSVWGQLRNEGQLHKDEVCL